jgi:hypothetical protein
MGIADIKDDGAAALADALKFNKTLRILDLHINRIKDTSALVAAAKISNVQLNVVGNNSVEDDESPEPSDSKDDINIRLHRCMVNFANRMAMLGYNIRAYQYDTKGSDEDKKMTIEPIMALKYPESVQVIREYVNDTFIPDTWFEELIEKIDSNSKNQAYHDILEYCLVWPVQYADSEHDAFFEELLRTDVVKDLKKAIKQDRRL